MITKYKHQRGFTLIELLLAITIIFILAGLSTPFYARFLNQTSVIAVEDQLVGQLRKAQTYAGAGRQGSDWGVYIGPVSIILFRGTSYAQRVIAFDETFTHANSISTTGITEVVFTHPAGIPSTTGSISVSGLGNTRTITINSEGSISRQ